MKSKNAKRLWAPAGEIFAAYVPIVRGYLLGAAGYYVFISLSHPFYETGWNLALLESMAVASAATGFFCWWGLKRTRPDTIKLEAAAAGMNVLLMANTIAYQTLHFEPPKLVYFVLMALAFATSAPTRRLALVSVPVAIAGLLWMARQTPGDLMAHYGFLGLASAVTAIGMSTLMRGAVMRELRARLASEALNRNLADQLAKNRRLRVQAQDLAVAAQGASRAKTAFLDTISHEIRTPLNGVLGMAQVMEAAPLDEDQRSRLRVLKASGQSLLQIINAVLDVSKIESGKMEIARADFKFDALADGLRQLYAGLAQDKGLAFRLEMDPAVAGWRNGDEARLRQVLGNLISNAIKFTDQGTVVVRVAGDAAAMVFSVHDTGVGIPADQHAQIFETFVQIDGSRTRRSGGAGLGLAICRELVKLMGGTIALESAVGAGSCFTVTLPLPAVDAPAVAAAAAQPIDETLRILIVDDNEVNRTVLTSLLGPFGMECGIACDGREAVAAWEAGRWDVILMDIHMPRMDGLDACRAIREAERASGRPRTSIIAVTASVQAHETDQYVSAGMDGLAPKPVELRRLMETIAACLSAQPGQAAAGPAAISA
jgi:signal transduction histidine kinase/ActR/RegA family two-component response regulator